jgi:hypothetical protein
MDFMHDALANGGTLRLFTLIDVYSRECLALRPATGFSGAAVAEILTGVAQHRALPKRILVDNGTEFTSKALDAWAYWNKVKLDFSRPGKPGDNAHVEAFNSLIRRECLSQHWFRPPDAGLPPRKAVAPPGRGRPPPPRGGSTRLGLRHDRQCRKENAIPLSLYPLSLSQADDTSIGRPRQALGRGAERDTDPAPADVVLEHLEVAGAAAKAAGMRVVGELVEAGDLTVLGEAEVLVAPGAASSR